MKKIIAKINQDEWYRQAATCYPNYADIPFRGMVNYSKISIFFKNRDYKAYFSKTDTKKICQKIIGRQQKDKNYLDIFWVRPWKKMSAQIDNYSKWINPQSLAKLNEKDLFFAYREFINLRIKKWKIGIIIDCFDPWGEYFTQTLITKNYPSLNKKELSLLTGQRKPSFIQKELHDRLEIVLLKKTDKKIGERIKKHSRQYYWLNNTWADIYYLDDKYFEKLISKELGRSRSRLKNEIYKLKNFELDNKRLIKVTYRKHRIDQGTINIFEFFSLMTDWRDLRKCETMKQNYISYLFLHEFSKRSKVPFSTLVCTDSLEPKGVSQLKKMRDRLSARKKGSAITFFASGKIKWFYGRSAKVLKNNLERSLQKGGDIRGNIVYPGKVYGHVAIINDFHDFYKMKKGKILLTSMTKPDFLPIIRKAAAIVTNEGGITSHAAIIAREMKIPCIIGTEIATDVLKDGDLIEVDANKGVVRKI